jgi:uncharacterized membrane protein
MKASRLDGLVDGIFAIVMTLLIIFSLTQKGADFVDYLIKIAEKKV